MADLNKVTAEISWSGSNVGCCLKEGDKMHDWADFTKDEQLKILSGLASIHNLFLRFVKE